MRRPIARAGELSRRDDRTGQRLAGHCAAPLGIRAGELELPDPIEIVRRYVADESPFLSAVDIDEIIDKTELATPDERTTPDSRSGRQPHSPKHCGQRGPGTAISKLRNPEEQVANGWAPIRTRPTSLLFATATWKLSYSRSGRRRAL